MGVLHISSKFTAFCIGKSIIIHCHSTSKTRVLNEIGVGKEKQTASKKSGDGGEPNIVAAETSPDGRYFVVACDAKVVVVFCTKTWKQLASHTLIKRPMALAITKDSSKLLVADKSGDVYEFPVLGSSAKNKDSVIPKKKNKKDDLEEPGGHQLLLGHLSMLLDVVLTEDNRYVITCDRDEKIRVSHYPNAYDIYTFCLGHEEFVTQISILPGNLNYNKLLSCSGDGTLRLWDYVWGECACFVDTREQLQHNPGLHQHYLNHRTTKMTQHKANDNSTGTDTVDDEKTDKQDEIRKTMPDYPALKCIALCSVGPAMYLVAVLLDKIPAIFIYKIDGLEMTYLTTVQLSSEPHTAAWRSNKELVVIQSEVEEKVRVFELRGNVLEAISEHPLLEAASEHPLLEAVPEHPLLEVGKKYKDYFKDWVEPLDVDVLYKQRYDNVADYLKKKEERLASEKAAQDGLIPPVKKGRWVK